MTSLTTLLIGVGIGVIVQQRWLTEDGSGSAGGDAEVEAPVFLPPLPGTQRSATPVPSPVGIEPILEALAVPTEFGKYAALYQAAAQAAAQADAAGVRELIFSANGIEAPWDRRTFLSVLYRRYAELDPGAAVDLVLETPYPEPGTYLAAIFKSWARMDLEAAIARARTLAPWLREQAAFGLFSSEELRNSGRLQEVARSLGLEQQLNDLELSWSLERAPYADPAAGWAALLQARTGVQDMMRYWGLVRQWVRTDPHAAMQATLALDNRQVRSFVLDQGLKSWGQTDGDAAFDWALGQPAGRLRSQAVQAVLEGLATSDRARALELVERLDLRDRRQAMQTILLNWTQSDPVGAAQWMATLADEEVTHALARNAAHRYAAIDADAAMRWAERLPADARNTAVSAVLESTAATDPERAAALTRRIEDGEARLKTTVAVARAWASVDPTAALRWLETSDVAARRQGQGEILANWVQNDPDTAIAALDDLGDVQSRDTAALRMLQSLSFYDGNTPDVEALYRRIVDPEMRRRAAASLQSQWAESQPELAEKYRQEAERLARDQANRNPS